MSRAATCVRSLRFQIATLLAETRGGRWLRDPHLRGAGVPRISVQPVLEQVRTVSTLRVLP